MLSGGGQRFFRGINAGHAEARGGKLFRKDAAAPAHIQHRLANAHEKQSSPTRSHRNGVTKPGPWSANANSLRRFRIHFLRELCSRRLSDDAAEHDTFGGQKRLICATK